MGEFFSVIKLFCATTLLVLILQVKFDDQTLETHFVDWIHTSSAVSFFQGTADGGYRVYRSATHTVGRWIDENIHWSRKAKESAPGRRSLIEFKRSHAVTEKQSRDDDEGDGDSSADTE